MPDWLLAAIAPPPIAGLSGPEKLDRIEKIKRDYDEITGKFSVEYAMAGDKFPGGVNAFMRQLALLAFEKRADLAAFLTPRELEDAEMRDTGAGQKVQTLLGNTAATDEQRRAVFELQKAFEDKFALTFDLAPPILKNETSSCKRCAWLENSSDVAESSAAAEAFC